MDYFKNATCKALGLIGVMMVAASPCVAAGAARPPWQVAEARSASEREIFFRNGDASLVGTLTVPNDASDKHAVIVALHAAAAPTRQYVIYRHLMQSLPRLGYAVFVYDRRGSGASTGDRNKADYIVLADDAIAAARRISTEAGVDARRIGYWGLSQGGWLAVLAAQRDASAAFAISVSAPLTTPAEQMQFAMANLLAARGYSKTDVADQARVRSLLDGYYIEGTVSREAAQNALDAVAEARWFKESYLPRHVEADPKQSSWHNELGYDPVKPLEALNVPVLMLFGDSDPWIPVQRSLDRLKPILRARRNITAHLVANADHVMALPASDAMVTSDAHMLKLAPEAPDYFLNLGSWLGSLGYGSPR